jgi:hypothetical protein
VFTKAAAAVDILVAVVAAMGCDMTNATASAHTARRRVDFTGDLPSDVI